MSRSIVPCARSRSTTLRLSVILMAALFCSDPAPPAVNVESIALSLDSIAIQFRDSSSELTATPRGALGVELDVDVAWRSRNVAIVKVVPNGKAARLVPVKSGSAEVEAIAEDVVATARVTVHDTVFSVELVPTDTLVTLGQALRYTASVTGPPGTPPFVKWEVSNPAVATIDSSQGVNPIRIVSRDTGNTDVIATSAIDRKKSARARFRTAQPALLQFEVEPAQAAGEIRADDAISPGLVVRVLDILGNVFIGPRIVTLAIAPGTGTPSASLFGRLIDTTVAGSARFDTVGFDLPGTGYRLTASSPDLAGTTSGTFNVTDACPGIPYVLGTTVSDAVGPSSCRSRPNEYYNRYIVTASTTRFFRFVASPPTANLRAGLTFPNRARSEPGMSQQPGAGKDSLFVVTSPGTFSLRVYTDSLGTAASYQLTSYLSHVTGPGVGACQATVDIHSGLTFQDALWCTNGGNCGSSVNSGFMRYRVHVPANKTVTVMVTSSAFAPCLEAFFPALGSRIDFDDNGSGGSSARLTFAAAAFERAIVLSVSGRQPVAPQAPFTITITP